MGKVIISRVRINQVLHLLTKGGRNQSVIQTLGKAVEARRTCTYMSSGSIHGQGY